VSDRDGLELGRSRDDLEQTSELRLLRERLVEDGHRLVVDVVVGSDHAQVEGRDIHVVDNLDRLCIREVVERCLNKVGKEVGEVVVRVSVHVVVEGVSCQTSVEPLPRAPIDGLLLVLNRLGDNLGSKVVVERGREMRLDGQSLVKELDKEGLADL
jgi:hypothetical protein